MVVEGSCLDFSSRGTLKIPLLTESFYNRYIGGVAVFEFFQLLCVDPSSNRTNLHEICIFSLIGCQRTTNKNKGIIDDHDGLNLSG